MMPTPSVAQSTTVAELQAQIAALLAQIAAMNGGEPSLPTPTTGPARITLEQPDQGDTYARDGETYITWMTSGISRPMVVEGVVKLKKADPKNVGAVGGGSFLKPIQAGSPFSQYTWDWGNNDSIPGTYSVYVRLRECNASGCDIAPAGRAVGPKSATVEFKVLNEVGGGEDEAEEAIDNADDAINSARDLLADANAPERYLEEADELLDDAEEFLEEAMAAFEDGDYEEAIDYAEEAIDLANDAEELLEDSDSSEEEVIDVDLEVINPAQGPAPFTATVMAQVVSRAPTCAIIRMGQLEWGDGTSARAVASTSSTAINGDYCTKTMLSVHSHTYTSAGTYHLKFTSDIGRVTDTATVTVTGTSATRTVDNKTFPTNFPTITGTARNTSAVGFSLIAGGEKAYGSGSVPVVNNRWSHAVTSSLADGTYEVDLREYANSKPLTRGSITVKRERTEFAAPSCVLSASPTTITMGQSVGLGWTSKNATYALMSGGSDKLDVSGRLNYSPATTTTYSLMVFGYGGKGSCSAKVTVLPSYVEFNNSDNYRYKLETSEPNTYQLEASALSAMKGQLDAMSKMLKELFAQ